MNKKAKIKKLIIIAGIFLLPAFFILFFKTGKANFFKLRYYGNHQYIQKEINGALVIDTIYYKINQFEVINHEGQKLTQNDFENKILVINSINGTCPNTNCNLDFLSFRRFLGKEVSENKKFKDVEIISYYNAKDTLRILEELKEFIDFYKINTEKWHIVIGDQAQFYDTDMDTQNPWLAKDKDFGFENVAQTMALLIDKDRHIRGKFITKYTMDIKRITKEISILMREEADEKAKNKKTN